MSYNNPNTITPEELRARDDIQHYIDAITTQHLGYTPNQVQQRNDDTTQHHSLHYSIALLPPASYASPPPPNLPIYGPLGTPPTPYGEAPAIAAATSIQYRSHWFPASCTPLHMIEQETRNQNFSLPPRIQHHGHSSLNQVTNAGDLNVTPHIHPGVSSQAPCSSFIGGHPSLPSRPSQQAAQLAGQLNTQQQQPESGSPQTIASGCGTPTSEDIGGIVTFGEEANSRAPNRLPRP